MSNYRNKKSIHNKLTIISYTGYPKYRNMVCGKHCLYLKYINQKQPIPIWETDCKCLSNRSSK